MTAGPGTANSAKLVPANSTNVDPPGMQPSMTTRSGVHAQAYTFWLLHCSVALTNGADRDGGAPTTPPWAIASAAVYRGVEAARERGARIIGVWLASDVDASALETAG